MRSSSIKSLLATATLIATVTIAVAPAAHAAQRGPSATERAQRTVTRLLQRIARITTLGLPGDPIPVASPLVDTATLEESTTTTTASPKKQR